ncbi:MAG: energy-coupling factor transport system ATP-binding protein [Microbacteriaceae bacterium]|nr:energy-coupling factor transport system ATP-binding protein [Microbacteriaceae bacterium]
MIRFDAVTVTYPGAHDPVLSDVSFEIVEGELVLVIGPTGAGKSTLLKCVNGLVPHFTGGRLAGRVCVAGRDTRTSPPRELADTVGYVGQDPVAGFVTDTVEDELAYGMESLGVAPGVMRRRVEETLDLLGLFALRDRPLLSLSAGEQQRVAIGSVLTVHPRVLVLDEPTSALDPSAADDVLAALTRLVHDLGLTVLVCEHRLERVVQYADRILLLDDRGVRIGEPAEVLASSPVAPPIVELGRLAGWAPLPLSIRDARRAAGPLRDRLGALAPPGAAPLDHHAEVVGEARGLVVSYDGVPALRRISLRVSRGEIVAVMGRNGAGKSTLLASLAGARRATSGTVVAAAGVGLVPQAPGDLLWAQTVTDECRDADRDARAAPGTVRTLLTDLAPDIDDQLHPRDLSEGQRLSLVLAIVLAAAPGLLALDEPTRGLDYAGKRRLVAVLKRLADEGHGVLLATHDVELVAEVADRMVVLADGDVVSDGAAPQIAVSSPVFAPQVAKVLAPLPFLTVDDVGRALASTR